MSNPKVSIVIPFHWMKNWQFFLTRCLESIENQSFKDYEVILTKVGSMPVTTNRVIQEAKGELIKVLYMDDYLVHGSSLEKIVEAFDYRHINFKGEKPVEWLITATDDNENPHWTDDIETGNNKLGSPSALVFRNHFESNLLFDENMSWLLDCDYYKRMYEKYGEPLIWNTIAVRIGKGDHQMTHILTNEQKLAEHEYIKEKYGKS